MEVVQSCFVNRSVFYLDCAWVYIWNSTGAGAAEQVRACREATASIGELESPNWSKRQSRHFLLSLKAFVALPHASSKLPPNIDELMRSREETSAAHSDRSGLCRITTGDGRSSDALRLHGESSLIAREWSSESSTWPPCVPL